MCANQEHRLKSAGATHGLCKICCNSSICENLKLPENVIPGQALIALCFFCVFEQTNSELGSVLVWNEIRNDILELGHMQFICSLPSFWHHIHIEQWPYCIIKHPLSITRCMTQAVHPLGWAKTMFLLNKWKYLYHKCN